MVKETRVSWEMGQNWDYSNRRDDFGDDEDDLDEGDLFLHGKRERDKQKQQRETEKQKPPESRRGRRESRGSHWKGEREKGERENQSPRRQRRS